MNKPRTFSSAKQPILFCSDLHLGHNPVGWDSPPLWATRGFDSIDSHDSWVRAKWHELVTPETIVFNLGDATFSDPKGERFRQLTTWPGQQLHIWGNHWSGSKQMYQHYSADEGIEAYPLIAENLTFIGHQLHCFIDGTSVYMQHYAPFIWPEMKEGGYALCGHSHSRCVEINPEDTTHGRILDVGVDNAIRLTQTPFFTWDQVQRIMAKKPIVTHDHH